MKKNLCIAASPIFFAATHAQVAINKNSLKATLDVTAKTTNGSKVSVHLYSSGTNPVTLLGLLPITYK